MSTSGDFRWGMGAIRFGCLVLCVVVPAGLVHVVIGASEHRVALSALVVLAGLDGLAMWCLVARRIAGSRWLEPVLMAWNLAHVVAIATAAILDGGLSSPFVALFFVSIVFAALTLSRPRLLLVAAWDTVGMVVVGLVGGGAELLVIYLPADLAIGLLSSQIAGELHHRITLAEAAKQETIQRLARAIEYRDADTGGHVDRMAAYARILAERLGLEASERERLHMAAPLHDVGKIGVPDRILLKPGPLTLEERVVMERHAQAGHDLLADSTSPVLELAAVIALCHHERWDGMGYPRRLQGEEIPLAARIVSVADVFDALTSDRVYRPAMPFAKAVSIVCDGRGTQFDPEVVDAFLAVLDRLSEVRAGGNPRPQAAQVSAREDRAVGAEDEPGLQAGADRPVLA